MAARIGGQWEWFGGAFCASKGSDKGPFLALSVQDKLINGFESTLSCLVGLVMCFDKVVHERVVAGDPDHFPLPALTNSFRKVFIELLYRTTLSNVIIEGYEAKRTRGSFCSRRRILPNTC